MAIVATGTTIEFQVSLFSLDVVSIDSYRWERPGFDVTPGGTLVPDNDGASGVSPEFGGDLRLPGSTARGSMTYTAFWDPSSNPPINAGAEPILITWPDGTTYQIGNPAAPNTISGGWLKRIDIEAAVEQPMLCECEVWFTGTVVKT